MKIICGNCGIEGIHACLGKPIKQEDLPKGVVLCGGDLTKKMQAELDKYDLTKLSI